MKNVICSRPLLYWLLFTSTLLGVNLSRADRLPDDAPGATGRKTSSNRSVVGKPVVNAKPRHPDRQRVSLSNDPIRFTLQSNKRRVAVGEVVELTVNAELMNLPPSLMFFLPGSNAYTLRLLLPTNFIQTSGDNLTEYHSAELSHPANTIKTYRIRGYFTTPAQPSTFRLLRGPAQANNQSLFVEKAQLSVFVAELPAASGARLASFSQCVEAETSISPSNRTAFADGQASGGSAVGGFGNSSEFMTYALPAVPTAGTYTLRLYYVTGDAQAGIGLVVNGGSVQTVTAPGVGRNTGPYEQKTTTITLNAGSNTLRIQGSGQGSFALDKFCVEGGTPPNSSLAISPSGTQTVGATAGSQSVNVTTNVNWTASSSDASWLTVSPASGSASGQVTLSYGANTGPSGRSASVTFSGANVASQVITIAQAGATSGQCVEAETSISPSNRTAFADGQASGGSAVGGFGNSSEFMTYALPAVPTAGTYTLRLYYVTGDAQAGIGLVVNGGSVQTVTAPGVGRNTGPYEQKTTTITLNAGSNTLRIQGSGQGSFALDRFCVEGGTCSPPTLSLGTVTCNGTSTYSVGYTAQTGAIVTTSAGTVQGSQVINIPVGTNATVTATLNGCTSQQTTTSPTCTTPPSGNCTTTDYSAETDITYKP